MNILFLITARGGSRGVPRKNIREIAGLPLLVFKARAAVKSDYCTRLIVSTDDDEIARVARKYDIEVPFMRPVQLATDEVSSIDVILHAMQWVEQNDPRKYDVLCLLEPSTPFLTHEDVNRAVELYQAKDALGVLGVREVRDNYLFVAEIGEDLNMAAHFEKMCGNYHTPRQMLKAEYTMNGAIYMVDWEYMKQSRTFHSPRTYAYLMPETRSIEIDNMDNFHYASFLVEKGIVDIHLWDDKENKL
ncbi:MAG: acylneuraminate cytidylyltransferase family protein [Syntrophomonadaceae bacterium]|nr:acylneuraminate cytidylyltransferase family protein [Syntrophomonadaceae bacterium]